MPKPFTLGPEQIEQAHKMRQEGMKLKDIASYFGLGKRAIQLYLNPQKREEHRKHRAENNLKIRVDGKGK